MQKNNSMKKLLALAVIALFAISCSNKNDKPWQDSNVMMEEPAATSVSATPSSVNTDANAAAPATPADSASAK